MILKKLKVIFFLLAICKLTLCEEAEKIITNPKVVPLHYYLISISGIVLMIVSILVYWFDLQEEKRVEFTVFNSQYIGK